MESIYLLIVSLVIQRDLLSWETPHNFPPQATNSSLRVSLIADPWIRALVMQIIVVYFIIFIV